LKSHPPGYKEGGISVCTSDRDLGHPHQIHRWQREQAITAYKASPK
jgi:hypothetical protein